MSAAGTRTWAAIRAAGVALLMTPVHLVAKLIEALGEISDEASFEYRWYMKYRGKK